MAFKKIIKNNEILFYVGESQFFFTTLAFIFKQKKNSMKLGKKKDNLINSFPVFFLVGRILMVIIVCKFIMNFNEKLLLMLVFSLLFKRIIFRFFWYLFLLLFNCNNRTYTLLNIIIKTIKANSDYC